MGGKLIRLRIGLVGTGESAHIHATACRNVSFAFGVEPAVVELSRLAWATQPRFGLDAQIWTPNWQDLIRMMDIDLIAIACPVAQRAEIALASLRMGKHVYSDQPLAADFRATAAVNDAARATSVVAMASFAYLSNPAQTLAQQMIKAGEIGEVTKTRSVFDVDTVGDTDTSFDPEIDALGVHMDQKRLHWRRF